MENGYRLDPEMQAEAFALYRKHFDQKVKHGVAFGFFVRNGKLSLPSLDSIKKEFRSTILPQVFLLKAKYVLIRIPFIAFALFGVANIFFEEFGNMFEPLLLGGCYIMLLWIFYFRLLVPAEELRSDALYYMMMVGMSYWPLDESIFQEELGAADLGQENAMQAAALLARGATFYEAAFLLSGAERKILFGKRGAR